MKIESLAEDHRLNKILQQWRQATQMMRTRIFEQFVLREGAAHGISSHSTVTGKQKLLVGGCNHHGSTRWRTETTTLMKYGMATARTFSHIDIP